MATQQSTPNLTTRTNLTGLSFDRWSVLSEADSLRKSRRYWLCVCTCGKQSVVDGKELRTGRSTGCYRCRAKKHGMRDKPEYVVWKRMKSRCEQTTNQDFRHYGGRGIRVCDEWQSFASFYRDMGPRPTPKHTIERIKNHLGYSKDNCRWATRKEQARNTRRNRLLTLHGVTKSIPDWAELVGVSYQTIGQRLRYGWSVERALTTPLQRNYVRGPSVS
jgi:hypothetical protein